MDYRNLCHYFRDPDTRNLGPGHSGDHVSWGLAGWYFHSLHVPSFVPPNCSEAGTAAQRLAAFGQCRRTERDCYEHRVWYVLLVHVDQKSLSGILPGFRDNNRHCDVNVNVHSIDLCTDVDFSHAQRPAERTWQVKKSASAESGAADADAIRAWRISIHIYTCTCALMCVYMYVRISLSLYMYTCISACIHACMHVCMHVCHVCMHVMYVCIHACMQAYVKCLSYVM